MASTMAHVFQVGVGSGGMVVLDLLLRHEQVKRLTLVEPDIYKPHNVVRHYFPPEAAGQAKVDLAAQWVKERRPEVELRCLRLDLLTAEADEELQQAAASCDIGICAVDNEPAKYCWDALMRQFEKPWTLGEVLSGGIGGFVHVFLPGGPCYGCVARQLRREVQVDRSPAPDYSAPDGPVAETTVPAPAAAIHAIASLHAVVTLSLLNGNELPFTSLLMTLQAVPDIFPRAFSTRQLQWQRFSDCLLCGQLGPAPADLDAALDEALQRLEA